MMKKITLIYFLLLTNFIFSKDNSLVPPSISVSLTPSICHGTYTDITVTSDTPNTTYTWTATTSNINSSYLLSGNQTNINQLVFLGNSVLAGSITITIIPFANGEYGSPQTININVNPRPNISSLPTTSICNNENYYLSINSLPNNSDTTYFWTTTANSVSGATAGTGQGNLVINQQLSLLFPDISGSVTYHITPSLNGCNGTTVNYTVIVNPTPNTGIGGEISVSEASTTPIDLFSIISGEQQGGNWNRISGTGGTFNAVIGTFTPEVGATNSTFTYELTNSSTNCSSSTFATINIDAIPTGLANTTNQTISNNDFSNLVLSSPNVPNSSFIWTFVANNISGASNGSGTTIAQQLSLIDTNYNGYVDYFITPVNNTAIGTTFSARVNIQSPLNSESFILDNFTLSPNPVVDNLNIENDSQIKNIRIYNQLGQMIFSNIINENKKTLNLSNLSSGIYTIFIETETRLINKKIIKQ